MFSIKRIYIGTYYNILCSTDEVKVSFKCISSNSPVVDKCITQCYVLNNYIILVHYRMCFKINIISKFQLIFGTYIRCIRQNCTTS